MMNKQQNSKIMLSRPETRIKLNDKRTRRDRKRQQRHETARELNTVGWSSCSQRYPLHRIKRPACLNLVTLNTDSWSTYLKTPWRPSLTVKGKQILQPDCIEMQSCRSKSVALSPRDWLTPRVTYRSESEQMCTSPCTDIFSHECCITH